MSNDRNFKHKQTTAIRCRCVRLNLYRQDDPTVAQLTADLNDSLFAAVLATDQHVLRYILPDRIIITLRASCGAV